MKFNIMFGHCFQHPISTKLPSNRTARSTGYLQLKKTLSRTHLQLLSLFCYSQTFLFFPQPLLIFYPCLRFEKIYQNFITYEELDQSSSPFLYILIRSLQHFTHCAVCSLVRWGTHYAHIFDNCHVCFVRILPSTYILLIPIHVFFKNLPILYTPLITVICVLSAYYPLHTYF